MNKKAISEQILKAWGAHPYGWAFLICLLLEPCFYDSYKYIPNNLSQLESFLFVGGLWGYLYYLYRTEKIDLKKLCLYALLAVLGDFCIVGIYAHTVNKAIWHFAGGSALTVGVYLFVKSEDLDLENKGRLNSLLIMALGFWLKFYYVLITPINVRQHDIGRFSRDGSFTFHGHHSGYIEYLLQYWHLPTIDVTKKWCYFHPPLHHIISAVWIWIHKNIFAVGYAQSLESLQTLSLFYTLIIIITAYKIFRYFKLHGSSLYIPMILVSLHPAYTLFSGSVNNDVLSVALMMCGVLFTLEWCEKKNLQTVLKIALCVGCGMMTKLSAALIFPLIVCLMLSFADKDNYKELFKQAGLLGIVTLPLGLWYQIRSYLKWGIPLNYVQHLAVTDKQYLGTGNFIERFTDFSGLNKVYEHMVLKARDGSLVGINDVNPLLTPLKNSLFGEYINERCIAFDFVNNVSVVFFWLNVVISVAACMAMLYVCCKKCGVPNRLRLFFASFYFLLLASFYKMSYDYPFVCTMNFRYITPIVIVNGLFIGLFLHVLKDNDKLFKPLRNTFGILVLLFAACSLTVYLSLKL